MFQGTAKASQRPQIILKQREEKESGGSGVKNDTADSADSAEKTPATADSKFWTLQELAKSLPNLSLIIDLTNTHKYYDCQSLKKVLPGVKYVKIKTEGRGRLPSLNGVLRFFNAVDNVIAKNPDCQIGVHCTHGVNRTGYYIGRYLIQKLKMDPEKAIEDIGASRGHPIEREQYIENLRQAPWKDDVLSDRRSKSRSSVKKMRKRRAHRSKKLDDRGMEFDRHDRDRDQYDRQSRRERRSSGNQERDRRRDRDRDRGRNFRNPQWSDPYGWNSNASYGYYDYGYSSSWRAPPRDRHHWHSSSNSNFGGNYHYHQIPQDYEYDSARRRQSQYRHDHNRKKN